MSVKPKWNGVIVLLALAISGCQTSPVYRPGQEYRTINAAEYEIAIQKNGRVDVLLRSGQVVLANAQPWCGMRKKTPRAASVRSRLTVREQVNDHQPGHSTLFKQKECEWAIRVYR